MMSEIKSSISEKLHSYYHYMNSIVVMPDFFVDRIIKLKSKEEFFHTLTEKTKFGSSSVKWHAHCRCQRRKCSKCCILPC